MLCLMPYVRQKRIRGRLYYYLVEGHREGDKVRQTVLCYLGEHATVKDALAHWRRELRTAKDAADKKHAREMVSKLEPYA